MPQKKKRPSAESKRARGIREILSAQQRFVAGKGFAGNLFSNSCIRSSTVNFCFFIAADIENDTAVVHHDQAVAVAIASRILWVIISVVK